MSEGRRRILITSALPYINGVKHLGNLIGSLLPADVIARFHRLRGHEVLYICGTDEHGTPAELAARAANLPVKEYCDQYFARQVEIYEKFGLAFDHFGRTSNSENHEITQEMFRALHENGHISEDEIQQMYCLEDNRFLPDRYIQGTCPNCSYERARGDQCENCTQVLNPTELTHATCQICNKNNVEVRNSRHLFIELPRLEGRVTDWLGYDASAKKITGKSTWPATTRGIAEHWLTMGLKRRGITRDLEWGVPVPLEGWEDKVFYVWFDAPLGYIGATIEWAKKVGRPEAWKEYWYNDETEYIQTMAKDNVPFHSISFPATLLGADKGVHLVDHLKSFEWLNYEGGKFSTSQRRGVFMDQALELFPPDPWRYYLLSVAPERHDTDFTWDGFQSALNNDLNDGIGNLVLRVLKFCGTNFGGKNPERGELGDEDRALVEAIEKGKSEVAALYEELEFQKALKASMEVVKAGNRYLNQKAPWKDVKETRERAGTTISLGIHMLRAIAIMFEPVIPFTSERLWDVLHLEGSVHEQSWDSITDDELPAGHAISTDLDRPFAKLNKKQKDALREQFAGEDVDDTDLKTRRRKKQDEPAGPADRVSIDQFKQIDLRVARILAVEEIPKSEKLLKLQIEIGDEKRFIMAGIKGHYSAEELTGRLIVVVANLKPKKMFGIKGEGMLLAADADGKPYLLRPDSDDVPTGSVIM